MSITKYKTSSYRAQIEAVEVERETDSSVFIDGRRQAKKTTYECYFDSWAEAKDYLFSVAESKVDTARRQLELANAKLGNIKGLKKPA